MVQVSFFVAGSAYDHPIPDGLLSVIWAHGQKQDQYTFEYRTGVHVPTATNPQFYKDDEFKYHGFVGNRGTATVDFSQRSE